MVASLAETPAVEQFVQYSSNRPNTVSPQLWQKVLALRNEPRPTLSGEGGYLYEIARRLSPPQRKQPIEIRAFDDDPKRLEVSLANARNQNAALSYAFEFKESPWLNRESKDQFVQSLARRYSILRMLHTGPVTVAAINVYTERMAEAAGYQLDIFQANEHHLRPPPRALSWLHREYMPRSDYVARVSNEVRQIAEPIRAVAFRHAMKTGDRSGYMDGDLYNALSYLDQERARRITEPVPELIEREHQLLVKRVQGILDSGRRFTESQIQVDYFKDLRPAMSL